MPLFIHMMWAEFKPKPLTLPIFSFFLVPSQYCRPGNRLLFVSEHQRLCRHWPEPQPISSLFHWVIFGCFSHPLYLKENFVILQQGMVLWKGRQRTRLAVTSELFKTRWPLSQVNEVEMQTLDLESRCRNLTQKQTKKQTNKQTQQDRPIMSGRLSLSY